jgi:hypothetical protein
LESQIMSSSIHNIVGNSNQISPPYFHWLWVWNLLRYAVSTDFNGCDHLV